MRVSLDGDDWTFKGFLDGQWLLEDAVQPDLSDRPGGWRRATVPGSLQHDLWRQGVIPDPYKGLNALAAEWAPQRSWVYRTRFPADEAWQGERARLVFEGLDYGAQVFLNGEELGSHRSQFVPAYFELGDRLEYAGENLLAVVLAPVPAGQSQFGRTSRAREHKTRMNYGWDVCPRLPHLGIWDSVYLEITGLVRLEDVWVRPQLTDDLHQVIVTVSLEVSASERLTCEVEIVLRFGGRTVAEERFGEIFEPGRSRINFEIQLDQPQLWWPNGHGAQALYEAEVILDDGSGEANRRTAGFGIRRLEWACNDTPDKTARPYVLQVNGRKIYLKGWNWLPLDALYGVERPEKLEHLLGLARRAGANLLRVWGGGLIEKKNFYDLCDRLGLMVWQEFNLSSSAIDRKPPADPSYLEMMHEEAEGIIPRRRNHPSLVLWCGGNELENLDFLPLDDSEPVLATLKEVVQHRDPDRLWLPTSASGPMPFCGINTATNAPFSMHDVHGPWHHQGLTAHYTLFNRSRALLHSEFGAEALASLRTLQATFPGRNLASLADDPAWRGLGGAGWLRLEHWREVFGDVADLPTLIRASQLLQAEGVRYAVEANRRRMFENSGSLPWMLNEPYPAVASTAAVEYYGQPKPLYWALARAYAPVSVSARFDSQVWAGQDAFTADIWVSTPAQGAFDDLELSARLISSDGEIHIEQRAHTSCPPNSARHLCRFEALLAGVTDVFFLDLELAAGASLARNRYIFSHTDNLAPLLGCPETRLEVHQDGTGFTLGNAGDETALFVWLEDARPVDAEGFLYPSDNHFCLLPGERRRLELSWLNIPPAERLFEVSCWNASSLTLAAEAG